MHHLPCYLPCDMNTSLFKAQYFLGIPALWPITVSLQTLCSNITDNINSVPTISLLTMYFGGVQSIKKKLFRLHKCSSWRSLYIIVSCNISYQRCLRTAAYILHPSPVRLMFSMTMSCWMKLLILVQCSLVKVLSTYSICIGFQVE